MQFLSCPLCKSKIDFDLRKMEGGQSVKMSNAEERNVADYLLALMGGNQKQCPVCLFMLEENTKEK